MNWKCCFPGGKEMKIDELIFAFCPSLIQWARVNKCFGRARRCTFQQLKWAHALLEDIWIFVLTVVKLEHKISNIVIIDIEMSCFDDLLKFPLLCYMYSLPESHTLKYSYSVTYLVSNLHSSALGFSGLTQLLGQSNNTQCRLV